MATTVRLRDDEEEMIKDVTLEMMFETKIRIKESDVIHALIRKHLKDIKTEDVMKYRAEVLKKDDWLFMLIQIIRHIKKGSFKTPFSFGSEPNVA